MSKTVAKRKETKQAESSLLTKLAAMPSANYGAILRVGIKDAQI